MRSQQWLQSSEQHFKHLPHVKNTCIETACSCFRSIKTSLQVRDTAFLFILLESEMELYNKNTLTQDLLIMILSEIVIA